MKFLKNNYNSSRKETDLNHVKFLHPDEVKFKRNSKMFRKGRFGSLKPNHSYILHSSSSNQYEDIRRKSVLQQNLLRNKELFYSALSLKLTKQKSPIKQLKTKTRHNSSSSRSLSKVQYYKFK
mmetsp:Transcript_19903/g.17590  ORF Transcript_19903/g.17590 Transcript_19903/m.17590 type:complete len:123 (-) Transcript_19903:242-610(-)